MAARYIHPSLLCLFFGICARHGSLLWPKSKERGIYKKEVRGLTSENNVNYVLNFSGGILM